MLEAGQALAFCVSVAAQPRIGRCHGVILKSWQGRCGPWHRCCWHHKPACCAAVQQPPVAAAVSIPCRRAGADPAPLLCRQPRPGLQPQAALLQTAAAGALQPTAEVVGILQRWSGEIVACISEEDERALAAKGESSRQVGITGGLGLSRAASWTQEEGLGSRRGDTGAAGVVRGRCKGRDAALGSSSLAAALDQVPPP